jgi:hypothetical protein
VAVSARLEAGGDSPVVDAARPALRPMYLCFAVPPALRLPGAREGLQWSPVSPVRARRASAAARTRVRSGRGAPHACTAGPTTVDVSLSDDVADDPMACSLAPALEADASALLDAALHGDEAELSLLLCSDAYISQLNERWRRVDKATDVLSFPQGDGAVRERRAFPPLPARMQSLADFTRGGGSGFGGYCHFCRDRGAPGGGALPPARRRTAHPPCPRLAASAGVRPRDMFRRPGGGTGRLSAGNKSAQRPESDHFAAFSR